jgi:hypothetical protein
MYFKAWKNTKINREAKMEEIQAKEQSRKNWTVRFWIAEYPILPEQVEFE